MSYRESYSGSQSGMDSSSDAFTHITQSIATNVQKISQNVNSMQRMVNQLGTPLDSESLRSQLHELQHETNQITKETNDSLKALTRLPQPANLSDQKERRMLKDRLMNGFKETLKNFQLAQETAARKEKKGVIYARANSRQSGSFKDEPSQMIQMQNPIDSDRATVQIEEEANLKALQDREIAFRQLETDIVDANNLFKDLLLMISEQGEVVDNIEVNITSASARVDKGARNLLLAQDYQSSTRRKTLCLVLILAAISVIVAVSIYVSVK
ncbi:Syntaxin-12 [Halotydeus destructor]|nr:Syntaxin-12 [Halotydeus destructor]